MPPAVLAYVVPSLVAAAVVQTWFDGRTVLAGGDLTPPVAPGTDYRAHWNQVDAGEGTPNFAIVALPFFEGLRGFERLGFDEVVFQRVWLTLLLAGAAASVVFLARSLIRSPLAAAVAGLLSIFNGYHLAAGFDPVPLAATIAAALLGGLVVRAGGEGGPRPLVFALVSIPFGFVFANPAQAVIVIAWVAASALFAVAVHGRRAPWRIGTFLLVAAPLALLFNLWWIVPALQTVTGPVFNERFAAPGIEAWAWTHARASVVNVVGLTSSWGWLQPEYFPFSARLERLPFVALQYMPATAAALGLVVSLALGRSRERWLALLLALIGGASILVMKGVHEPLSGANVWLYGHVPGFWLLRDPAKVALILVLVVSLLAALGVARLTRFSPWVGTATAIVVVGGAVTYAYPLYTGAIVPTDRPLLPSAHVRVPDEWRQAARYLEADPADGKVVVLPRLDYYQVPTTWGYYGSSFLHQLIKRPVIEVLPGGYYRDPPVARLVEALEDRIQMGNGAVTPLLRTLGARYVVLRRDLDASFPGRSFTDPRVLSADLRRVSELRRVRTFGAIDIYEAPGLGSPEVYAVNPVVHRGASAAALSRSLSAPQIAFVHPSARTALGSTATGDATLVDVTPEAREATVQVAQSETRVRVPTGSSSRTVSLRSETRPFRLLLGDADVTVNDPRTRLLVSIASPARRRLRPLVPIALRPRLAEDVGDCNKYDSRSLKDVAISATVTRRREGRALRMRAREHAACVSLPIEYPTSGERLLIRFQYRGVAGNMPRACIWQEGPDECSNAPPLVPSPDWHRYEATVEPRTGTTSVRLFLYADGGAEEPTITEYRAIASGSAPEPLGVGVVPVVGLPHVAYRRQTPYSFRVRVRNATRPFVLVTTETFAPGWKVKAPAGRSGDVPHFRVNGYANGWRIPWTGSYELTVTYGPERPARVARLLDLAAVPIAVLLLVLWPRGFRRRRA